MVFSQLVYIHIHARTVKLLNGHNSLLCVSLPSFRFIADLERVFHQWGLAASDSSGEVCVCVCVCVHVA